MKRYCRIVSLVALLAVITLSCKQNGSSEQVVLRFAPQLGEVYPVSMEINSQSKFMGMNNTTDMAMGFTMVPESENDTQVTLRVEYTHIGFDMQSPMGGMSYDSEDTSEAVGLMGEMIKPVFDKMLAGQLQMSFDRYGKVIATAGMEELLEGVEGMGNIADQVNAAGQMGIAMAVFPDKPVAIGDTWQTTVVNQESAPILMEATYKLAEIKNDVVVIELVGESSLYQGEAVDPALAAIFSDVTGEFTGTLIVDRKTGFTREATISQQMQMKLLQGGMPITVDVLNEISLDGKQ